MLANRTSLRSAEFSSNGNRRDTCTVRRSPRCLPILSRSPTILPKLPLGERMIIFGAGHFQFGFLLLAAALAVSVGPAAAQSYTPEQEQACTGDAFRLCSSEIPDVGRVTACMVAKKDQLSPPCRVYFRPDPEPSEAAAGPVGRPTVIRPATPRMAASAKANVKARKAKKPVKPAS